MKRIVHQTADRPPSRGSVAVSLSGLASSADARDGDDGVFIGEPGPPLSDLSKTLITTPCSMWSRCRYCHQIFRRRVSE